MVSLRSRVALAAALAPALLFAGTGVASADPIGSWCRTHRSACMVELKGTLSYRLTADDFPASNINITYIGDDGKWVSENKVWVTAGWRWTRSATAKINTVPWLMVSVNSAGLAGLKLQCSASSTPILRLANTPNPIYKSGTIEFAGGFTPQSAKTCG